MDTVTLTAAPALGPLLARGALRSPFKRPAPDAAFPRTRLVLSGVRVDLTRLAAYERVCGFPTGELDLPVTYPHVLGFPLAMRLMSGRDFPLPLLGLVHTSIEIVRRAALPADAEYELSVFVEGLAAHRRGTEATVGTCLRLGGDLVWESRSTYLARHGTASAPAPAHPPTRLGRHKPNPHGAPPRTPEDAPPERAASAAERGGGPEDDTRRKDGPTASVTERGGGPEDDTRRKGEPTASVTERGGGPEDDTRRKDGPTASATERGRGPEGGTGGKGGASMARVGRGRWGSLSSGGSVGTWGGGTGPLPGIAIPFICTRSRPASSAFPGPSRTACGRWPAVSPPTARPTRPRSGPGSRRRCCCRAR
ncbi:hypothetical protein GCM10017687_14000 [Streptomyces echinatus]